MAAPAVVPAKGQANDGAACMGWVRGVHGVAWCVSVVVWTQDTAPHYPGSVPNPMVAQAHPLHRLSALLRPCHTAASREALSAVQDTLRAVGHDVHCSAHAYAAVTPEKACLNHSMPE
jgi:hypothetical protein